MGVKVGCVRRCGVFIECGSFMESWRGMKWIEGGEEDEEEDSWMIRELRDGEWI